MKRFLQLAFVAGLLLLVYDDSYAQAINGGFMDSILAKYINGATTWGGVIRDRALWLFWILAVISLTWTFSLMALRNADIAEFLLEFLKFTIFIGFFNWLLLNGPEFAMNIARSFMRIGSEAGKTNVFSPSSIVDRGFDLFSRAVDKSSGWEPIDSLMALAMSLGILVFLTFIAINMLILLCTAYVVAYSGAIFLGFGGSRWTSDMAIQYFKTALNIAVQLLVMVLLVGIGMTILDQVFATMGNSLTLKELAVTLCAVLVLSQLTKTIPPMVAGMSGASIGSTGISGGGMLATAAAAAATGGAAVMAAAHSAMGGASAVSAAVKAAQASVAAAGGPGGLKGGLAVAKGAAGNLAGAAKTVAMAPGAHSKAASSTFGGRMAAAINPPPAPGTAGSPGGTGGAGVPGSGGASGTAGAAGGASGTAGGASGSSGGAAGAAGGASGAASGTPGSSAASFGNNSLSAGSPANTGDASGAANGGAPSSSDANGAGAANTGSAGNGAGASPSSSPAPANDEVADFANGKGDDKA